MNFQPNTLYGLLITLLLFSICPSSARADNQAIHYILDASGSMWGRVSGKTKIQVAKDVMSDLLTGMPDGFDTGLTVYGHRKKGDCTDIEEVIATGPTDKAVTLGKISGLVPKGMTPISDSIVFAAEKLKSRESQSTIVLVSDGIESCGKDPCAVAQKLKESGAKFVMHVVGFDVGGETERQLQCVAQAGGGKYFQAKNAADLATVLNSVKSAVVEKKAEIEVPAALTVTAPVEQKVSSGSTSVRIKAQGPGKVVIKQGSWLKAPYYWKLVNPETGKEVGRFNSFEPATVPAGTYQILWRQDQHRADDVLLSEVVTVESGKTTEAVLNTAVRFVVPTWLKVPPYRWYIADPQTNEKIAAFTNRLETEAVPPGQYKLVWRQEQHRANDVDFGIVDIQPDRVNEVKLLSGINPLPADWVVKEPYFWELHDKTTKGRKFTFFGEWSPQIVPPGTYSLQVRLKQHSMNNTTVGEATVKDGELLEYAVNTGITLITQPGTPVPDRVRFVPLDDSTNRDEVVLHKDLFPLPLQSGRYKILLRENDHSGTDVTIVESLELASGTLAEVEM